MGAFGPCVSGGCWVCRTDVVLGCGECMGLAEPRKQPHRPAFHPQLALPASRSLSGEGKAGERARGMLTTKVNRPQTTNRTSPRSPTPHPNPPKFSNGSHRLVPLCTILYLAKRSLLISPGPRQAWGGGGHARGSARTGKSLGSPHKGSFIPSFRTQWRAQARPPRPSPT